MRKSLFIFAVLVLLLQSACGGESMVRTIDDGPEGGGRNFAAVGPVHSSKGWQHIVKMHVASNAPEIVVEATISAINRWNAAAGKEIVSYEGVTEPVNRGSLYSVLDDDVSILYYEDDFEAVTGKSSYVLGTAVWQNGEVDESTIISGDIITNAESFNFQDALTTDPYDADSIDIADAESVIVHELGHLLGLDHVSEFDDPDSVMHTTTPVGVGFAKRTISIGDQALIQSIYSPN